MSELKPITLADLAFRPMPKMPEGAGSPVLSRVAPDLKRMPLGGPITDAELEAMDNACRAVLTEANEIAAANGRAARAWERLIQERGSRSHRTSRGRAGWFDKLLREMGYRTGMPIYDDSLSHIVGRARVTIAGVEREVSQLHQIVHHPTIIYPADHVQAAVLIRLAAQLPPRR